MHEVGAVVGGLAVPGDAEQREAVSSPLADEPAQGVGALLAQVGPGVRHGDPALGPARRELGPDDVPELLAVKGEGGETVPVVVGERVEHRPRQRLRRRVGVGERGRRRAASGEAQDEEERKRDDPRRAAGAASTPGTDQRRQLVAKSVQPCHQVSFPPPAGPTAPMKLAVSMKVSFMGGMAAVTVPFRAGDVAAGR